MSMRWLTGLLFAALLPLISIPAAAQEAVRTIGQYDKEVGVQYVASWENDDRWGNGFLVQGGYKVNACRLWSWQCQGIAELSVVNSDYYDASLKQFALGVRFGKLMWPKIRPFGQFQVGVQNDGFDDSSSGNPAAATRSPPHMPGRVPKRLAAAPASSVVTIEGRNTK